MDFQGCTETNAPIYNLQLAGMIPLREKFVPEESDRDEGET